jgi:hypothetical protein
MGEANGPARGKNMEKKRKERKREMGWLELWAQEGFGKLK